LPARGTAEAHVVRLRHHEAGTPNRYVPQGQMARDMCEAMETARCEAGGARTRPGTASNIDAKIATEAERKGYGQITQAADAPLAAAAGYLVRHLATGRPLPEAAGNVMELWRGFIEDHCGGTLDTMDDSIADQAVFAKFARQMIQDLGYGDQLGDDPDEFDDEQEEEASSDEQQEEPDQTGSDEDDSSDDAEANPEQAQDQEMDAAEAQVSLVELADMDMSDYVEMP